MMNLLLCILRDRMCLSLIHIFYPNYSEDITFTIANTGLLDAKGYDLKVTDKNGNTLYEDSSDNIIESGNSINVSVPWTIPSNLENEEVTVTVLSLIHI